MISNSDPTTASCFHVIPCRLGLRFPTLAHFGPNDRCLSWILYFQTPCPFFFCWGLKDNSGRDKKKRAKGRPTWGGRSHTAWWPVRYKSMEKGRFRDFTTVFNVDGDRDRTLWSRKMWRKKKNLIWEVVMFSMRCDWDIQMQLFHKNQRLSICNLQEMS